MIIIRREDTEEGYKIPFQQTELPCGTEMDGSNPSVNIIWPATVSHKIDDQSPLYDLKPGECNGDLQTGCLVFQLIY